MFFNSFAFVGFFIAVLLLLFAERLFGKSVTVRNITLLALSYFFYGYFNLYFTLILLLVTAVNYFGGTLLFSRTDIKQRKSIVAVTTILSLLPLVFYKYALFILSSFSALLNVELHIELLDGLFLPIGISFFTFQALSYTIDVYRHKIERKATPLEFSLFVAFFPTILSGPIEKARNLLPQIGNYFMPSASDIAQGACIFTWGLFKKMVIADRLAEYVDYAYATSEWASGATLALAAAYYSIQIYCDFSGYSDMALGVAKALGFDITKNFRQPYFSRTFKDFWRRWHIALTSWFTEYVYFSLGGSRVKHKLRWVFNISTIFILSGIWHGAAWNFLIWGALHAVYYLAEHFLGLQKKDLHWTWFGSFLSGCVVFILATVAWIFFRVETFDNACQIIGSIGFNLLSPLDFGVSTFTFAVTAGMLVIFLLYELAVRRGWLCYENVGYEKNLSRNIIAAVPMLIFMALCGITSDNFVYFKF